jgi:hypothetical protein
MASSSWELPPTSKARRLRKSRDFSVYWGFDSLRRNLHYRSKHLTHRVENMNLNIKQKSLKVYDGDELIGTVKVLKNGVYFDFAEGYMYPAGSLIEIAKMMNSIPLSCPITESKE